MKNIKSYWFAPSFYKAKVDLKLQVKYLLQRVSRTYRIGIDEMKSKTRLRHISEPRQIAMYIMHKKYGVSSTITGMEFNLDHATVLHACKKISGFMEFDKEYRNKVNSLI